MVDILIIQRDTVESSELLSALLLSILDHPQISDEPKHPATIQSARKHDANFFWQKSVTVSGCEKIKSLPIWLGGGFEVESWVEIASKIAGT